MYQNSIQSELTAAEEYDKNVPLKMVRLPYRKIFGILEYLMYFLVGMTSSFIFNLAVNQDLRSKAVLTFSYIYQAHPGVSNYVQECFISCRKFVWENDESQHRIH